MSTKIKVFAFFIVLVVGISVVLIANAINKANDYVHITALNYDAVLIDNEEGTKVRVKEQITFDIHAASPDNGMWELWRDLPEEWENGERIVSYNVLSVTRLTTNGQDSYLEFGKADKLYWDDSDYYYGADKWFHSKGPYDDYRNFECVLIYVRGLYRQTVVFEIEYEIVGAAVKYNDCSELYLPMYSGTNVKYLNEFNVQIHVPQNDMPSSGNYHAWTYGTNAHEIPFTESDSVRAGHHSFSFNLKKSDLKFKPYNEYIEFSLVAYGQVEKHLFTQNVLPRNTYYEDVYEDLMKAQAEYEGLPARYLTKKVVVLVIILAICALIILLVFYNDKKLRRKYNFTKPSIKYDFYREIPGKLDATFAGAFAFCKHKMSDNVAGGFAAAMLGLVNKKYIEAEQIEQKKGWEPENTKIIILKRINVQADGDVFGMEPNPQNISQNPQEPMQKLSETEAIYFKLLVRHAVKGQISLDSFQSQVASDYEYTDAIVHEVRSTVKTIGVKKQYFKERSYKEPKMGARKAAITLAVFSAISFLANLISRLTRLDLAFGAFFALGLSFLAAAIIVAVLSRSYVLLTQTGEDEYSKWRGLYNFLNSETLMNERTVPEAAIWEDYLLYATAFGISDKVIKALDVKFPEFNKGNSLTIRHPFLSTMVFTHMYSRSFRRAASMASFSRVARGIGGSFGGGGGFGGYNSGGRGGGSGGGGH